jgi:hypothetical protein
MDFVRCGLEEHRELHDRVTYDLWADSGRGFTHERCSAFLASKNQASGSDNMLQLFVVGLAGDRKALSLNGGTSFDVSRVTRHSLSQVIHTTL